jgi:TorA maturation chaperone TorD
LARAGSSLLDRLAKLRGDPSPLGVVHVALAEAASRTDTARVEREYFNLFIGLGRGELLPYGSYYQSGFLHERPLARLRADLSQRGIERVNGQCEPEDHAAIL